MIKVKFDKSPLVRIYKICSEIMESLETPSKRFVWGRHIKKDGIAKGKLQVIPIDSIVKE